MDASVRRRPGRRRLALMLAGILAVAAACGGDDDDDAGNAATTEAAAETTAAAAAGSDATTPESAATTEGSEATTGSTAPDSSATTPAGESEDGWIDPAAVEGIDRDATLRVAWQLNLATADPYLNPNAQNVAYNFLVYDALIYRDPDGNLFPGLATSWEWSDDGTQFTLQLREGVTFHDGSTLDSAVVKANLDRLLSMTRRPCTGPSATSRASKRPTR